MTTVQKDEDGFISGPVESERLCISVLRQSCHHVTSTSSCTHRVVGGLEGGSMYVHTLLDFSSAL